jgi:hypothetical protein
MTFNRNLALLITTNIAILLISLVFIIAVSTTNAEARQISIVDRNAGVDQIFPNILLISATAKNKIGKSVSSISTGFQFGQNHNIVTGKILLDNLGVIRQKSLRITVKFEAYETFDAKVTSVSKETGILILSLNNFHVVSRKKSTRPKSNEDNIADQSPRRPNSLCADLDFSTIPPASELYNAKVYVAVYSDRYSRTIVSGNVISSSNKIISEIAQIKLQAGAPVFDSFGYVVGVAGQEQRSNVYPNFGTPMEIIPIDEVMRSISLAEDENCVPEVFLQVPPNPPSDYCYYQITTYSLGKLNCDGWDPEDEDIAELELDEGCNLDALHQQLVHDKIWHEAIKTKRLTGSVIESTEMNSQIISVAANQRSTIDFALKRLNTTIPTYLLIYGNIEKFGNTPSTCVWLVRPNGQISSGITHEANSYLLPSLWNGLKVSSRNRVQRTAGSDDDCLTITSARPAPDGAAIQDVLLNAAKAILPDTIAAALASASNGSRLLIAPTGEIAKLPFSAFPIPGGQIVDKFAVVMLPNLQSLTKYSDVDSEQKSIRQNDVELYQNKEKVLVIGEPDLNWDKTYCWSELPFASIEAAHVATLMGVEPLLGTEANYNAVRRLLTNGQDSLQLIYIASHGVTDPENPADGSYVALDGEHLRGRDLRKLHFSARPIVVLSACETGLGKVFPNQGVFGLVDQWYLAGGAQIAASLWDVDDEGNAALMQVFSTRLVLGQNQNSEFALQRAMLEIRKKVDDPALWASMMVYGDPSISPAPAAP